MSVPENKFKSELEELRKAQKNSLFKEQLEDMGERMDRYRITLENIEGNSLEEKINRLVEDKVKQMLDKKEKESK